jgi:hypothetical protein
VPHLLQNVSNGSYYGRIKLNGKTIRDIEFTGFGLVFLDMERSGSRL